MAQPPSLRPGERTTTDFLLDKGAHIWYGSPPGNRIGRCRFSNRHRRADVG
jgi:hypothetical protein